jgi:hypothetical protein
VPVVTTEYSSKVDVKMILSVRVELKRRTILASLYTPSLHKLIVKEATELRDWSKFMTTGRQEQLVPL